MQARTPAAEPPHEPLPRWRPSDDSLAHRAVAPLRALRARPARRRDPETPAPPVCPTWSRLFERTGWPPHAVGAAIAAALSATFALLDLWDGNLAGLLSGEVPPWAHVEVRSALVVAALLAGVVVTHRYEELGIRRDVRRLAPRLREGDDPDALEREVGGVDAGRLRVAGLLGAGLIAALVPTLYVDPSRFLRPSTWALPSVCFDVAVGLVLGWTVFRTLYASVAQDRAFARLSGRVAEVDPLDLTPLHPFARRGQRRALRWLLLCAVAALVFVDAGLLAPPALVFAGIVAFAMFSFLLPVHGIHRRIREEKRRQLALLRAALRAERERLQVVREPPTGHAGRGSGHLADLLAWEARVAAAREWPLDTSTLLRFALLLLLPLGSWLGSAFVERALDAALG